MEVWSKRFIRFWCVLLLPLAIYFGYQAYSSHKSVGFWQKHSSEWLARIDSTSSHEPLFNPEEKFDEAILKRDRNIEKRFNYGVATIILFFSPAFLWLVVSLSKWVWVGKVGKR